MRKKSGETTREIKYKNCNDIKIDFGVPEMFDSWAIMAPLECSNQNE